MKLTTIKQADEITGKLSDPSKMPGYSYNLPAWECKVGSKLSLIPGTPCFKCYAKKGRYAFPLVKNALYRRFKSLNNPNWINAMVYLILTKRYKGQHQDHFRWHDSGDLQSVEHLEKITKVCKQTPKVKHWLPTQERAILKRFLDDGGKIPKNLVIRVSSPKLNTLPSSNKFPSSTVTTEYQNGKDLGYQCPASKQGNECKDCRVCWDGSVKNVNYKKH